MTKLFIGGFPLNMTELELVQLVAPYADVVTIKLVYDRATKKCKGYGFIEVNSDADAVIEALDGMAMGDRVLTLNIVPDQAPAKPLSAYRKVERGGPVNRPKRPRRPSV